MNEAIWYYLDDKREQQGPVPAESIRDALRSGRIRDTTLVWRDGLAEWLPLARVALELGITSVATPAPPSAADTDAAPMVPPPTAAPMAAADDVVPAGFVRRWAALFLDSLVLAIPLTIITIGVAIALASFASGDSSAAILAQGAFYVLYLLVAALYYAGMESSRHQATLGKQALGIKVVDNDGRRLSFGRALGRWFAAALSYLTFYIGFLMAAFTERKRALHDMIAGTLVVDRWAYTDHPEKQKRELSGCLIAVLIGMLLVPAVIGIFAAIAVSQFQDYTLRAQVSEGVALADGAKTAIAEYRIAEDKFPANNAEAGLAAPEEIVGSYVSRVDIGSVPGQIEVTFSATSPQHANAQLDGASLLFTAADSQGSLEWHCHSDTLRQKWCPSSCECQ